MCVHGGRRAGNGVSHTSCWRTVKQTTTVPPVKAEKRARVGWGTAGCKGMQKHLPGPVPRAKKGAKRCQGSLRARRGASCGAATAAVAHHPSQRHLNAWCGHLAAVPPSIPASASGSTGTAQLRCNPVGSHGSAPQRCVQPTRPWSLSMASARSSPSARYP